LSCVLCSVRREKRFCPAVHGRICPQCCGEQREVTLDCPTDCTYLQQARQHQELRRVEDIPAEELFPTVEISERFLRDREPLIVGISHTIAKLFRSDSNLTDREVITALTTMARSYQTLVGSGLVYQEALPGLVQQAITDALRQFLQEFRELEQQHLGYSGLKDGEVLAALVFTLRWARFHTSGRPRSRQFVDFLRNRFLDSQPSIAAADGPSSRIIIP
jgi:hypothetical protein